MILAEVIRAPHRRRNWMERRQKRLDIPDGLDVALDLLLAFAGLQVLPLIATSAIQFMRRSGCGGSLRLYWCKTGSAGWPG